MKRMSEVFELPLKAKNLQFVVDDTSLEDDAAIIHAINNVDKLADALESVLNTNRGTLGRIIIEVEGEKALVEALAAYRGAL